MPIVKLVKPIKGKATPERVVEVWTIASKQGHNIIWVAQELGITHQAAYYWKAKLRKLGVRLPKLPRYDVGDEKSRLSALIAESLGEKARGSKDAAA
jgi:hypothetical protein